MASWMAHLRIAVANIRGEYSWLSKERMDAFVETAVRTIGDNMRGL